MGYLAPRSAAAARAKVTVSMKRLVVKVGTSTVIGENPGGPADRVFLNTLAAQIAQQKAAGKSVVLVTSGAVGAGMFQLKRTTRPRTLPEKQACASVGQGVLMALYADIFANYGISVGQVLLTRDDFRQRIRYNNARNTFEALLAAGVLPVVNENDTVATDEIKVGDNDTLAALVASLVSADGLLLLSDVNGLFDKNPAVFTDAQLIENVPALSPEILAAASSETGSVSGTGGMRTKLAAAQIAVSSGIGMWIARGRRPNAVADCLAHAPGSGTYFAPLGQKPSAHKRWLAWGSDAGGGSVQVNAPARRALEEEGRSLLPVGVVGVSGDFAPGDLINVRDGDTVFARGIAQFSSADTARLAGVSTAQIAAALSLANPPPHVEIIHRDRLVLLPVIFPF